MKIRKVSHELWDRSVEIIQSEQEKERFFLKHKLQRQYLKLIFMSKEMTESMEWKNIFTIIIVENLPPPHINVPRLGEPQKNKTS